MAAPVKQDTGRADRILDAAGALLLRLGHSKVTIDDIAKRAGVGKGTVYLHWRTKEQLFKALLLRETINLVAPITDRLREDPGEVIPHRFARYCFLAVLHQPLMMALVTGDADLLGKFKHDELRGQQLRASGRYHDLMIRHRLLRDDVPHVAHALRATVTGFYLIDSLHGEDIHQDLAGKADALAHTVRHAFEPAGEPDPAAVTAAASELTAVIDGLLASYREWIYAPDPASRPGSSRTALTERGIA